LTGLSPSGMKLLQQYIDKHSDIQTAALIVSRIVEPDSHGFDKVVSSHAKSQSDDDVVVVKDRNLYLAYTWLYEYRQFLNKMELYIERAHLDVELGRQYRSRLEDNANSAESISRQSTKQQSTSSGQQQPKKRNALNSSSSSSKPQIKGSKEVCNAIYRIFDPSNHSFFHLRCTYCAASLPVSVIEKDKRMGHQRTQKDILQCCSKCSRQLPRCYVCQLHMVRHVCMYVCMYVCILFVCIGTISMSTSVEASLSLMSFHVLHVYCTKRTVEHGESFLRNREIIE